MARFKEKYYSKCKKGLKICLSLKKKNENLEYVFKPNFLSNVSALFQGCCTNHDENYAYP